ncbi:uncharacterized protein RCC_00054 [Lecanosticta acicola]|uniref:Uncharacterized protein RCC_00054 n=1 Tax=Lecanosticta acicola TaxID=111012 RepID=A0AAI8Z8J8_9PEZI|nr:uncharacterized protein RCC_00054 [Lecanosticta acicola]
MEQIQPHIDRAQKFVLDRIPEDRSARFLLAGGTLSVASAVLYPLVLHYALGRQVTLSHLNSGARAASVEVKEIESLPSDVIERSKRYRIYHDKIVKFLPNFTVALSNRNEDIFTRVLRRNMVNFSTTLQGYLLWFAAKDERRTFTKQYIESLDFRDGDLVCGVYRVVKRTPLKAELAIEPTKDLAHVSGLIVITVRPRNEGAILTSETIQWIKKDNGLVLPLERWLYSFMHSITSRSLILKAARYLDEISY